MDVPGTIRNIIELTYRPTTLMYLSYNKKSCYITHTNTVLNRNLVYLVSTRLVIITNLVWQTCTRFILYTWFVSVI